MENLRRLTFIKKVIVNCVNNPVMSNAINNYALCGEYHAVMSQFNCNNTCSIGRLKNAIFSHFSEVVHNG